MKSSRIDWVDIYKGILIFLMVLGHSCNIFLLPWIYGFHMAGFFFISGYTTNYDKYDFVTYIKKKTKSLLVPFIGINVFSFIIQLLLNLTGLYNVYYNNQFSFTSLINFFKYFSTFDLAGASWFLFVLYIASILSKLLYDIIKGYNVKDNISIHLIICFIIFIIFYCLFYRTGEKISYFLDLIPISTFFLSLGTFAFNKNMLIKNKYNNIIKILLCCFYITNISFYNQPTDWAGRIFPPLYILLFNSLGGILLLIGISKIIVFLKNKIKLIYIFLNYLGKNTLEILKYHFLSFRVIFTILYVFKYLDISKLKCLVPPYYGFIETLLTAVIAVIFSLLFSICINYIYKIMKKVINNFINKIPEKYNFIALIKNIKIQ